MSESLWRREQLRGERARKFIHIAAALVISIWPFFMSFRAIRFISVAMVAVILLSRWFNIFKGIHSVERRTMGDIFFPASVFVIAMITSSDWVFMAAILHLGLADGMAAVVGDRALKYRYKVFGESKSLAGSFTFWVFSVLITGFVVAFGPLHFVGFGPTILLLLPIAATAVESISVRGTDNLFVPLLVAAVLNQFVQIGLL